MIRKTTPMAILVQPPDKQKPGGGTGLPNHVMRRLAEGVAGG